MRLTPHRPSPAGWIYLEIFVPKFSVLNKSRIFEQNHSPLYWYFGYFMSVSVSKNMVFLESLTGFILHSHLWLSGVYYSSFLSSFSSLSWMIIFWYQYSYPSINKKLLTCILSQVHLFLNMNPCISWNSPQQIISHFKIWSTIVDLNP